MKKMTVEEYLALPTEKLFKVDLTQVDFKSVPFDEFCKNTVPIEVVYKEIFGKELDNNNNK